MSNKLGILPVQTFSVYTMSLVDTSIYDPDPPLNPTLEISVPGFEKSVVGFAIKELNILTSLSLGLTAGGEQLIPLPDGVYTLKYSVSPAISNFIERNIMRVDRLQEKFDKAFLTLDMMECDRAIKTQQKVMLSSIYFFIQGSIAAANNCAIDKATKLYQQADKMLDNFMKNGCQCTGTNYPLNFV